MIKLIIVDDNERFLNVMKIFLEKEQDISVVGIFTDKDSAKSKITKIEVDIILMDINLTDNNLDGFDAVFEISEICKAKTIMLTSLNGEEIYLKAFNTGAVYYIKKENYKDLPKIIREVYSGNSPLEALVKNYNNITKELILNNLTVSEREILELSIKGNSYKGISIITRKAMSTIKNQSRSIIRKFNSKNLKEAVRKINRRNI